jgi:hypothetical protein
VRSADREHDIEQEAVMNGHQGWMRLRSFIPLAVASAFVLAGSLGCAREDAKPTDKAEEVALAEGAQPDESPRAENKLRPRQVGRNTEIPGLFQNWSPHVTPRRLTDKQKKEIAKLESLGYVSGSRAAPANKNVVHYDRAKAYEGLNLYTSGHAGEAILIDMEGTELHGWRYDFWEFMPDFEVTDDSYSHVFWRRAHLYPNGDLLAIYEGICMLKLDKDSNLIWGFPGRPHHDIFVHPDGRIFTLTRRGAVNEEYHPEEPILEDFVSVLDTAGNEIRRVSILRALERSAHAHLIEERMRKSGDILHTNTIQVLDGELEHLSPAFRKGNVLVSILWLDFVGVIDMDEEKFVWGMNGPFKRQHEPILMSNGRMMLFDNQGGDPRFGGSRIMEFDPLTGNVFWEYEGTEADKFYSYNCGTMQPLPNGNTLISESTTGRVLEVTRDKEKVWEWLNPHRAGDRDQYIANVLEMERFGPEFPFVYLKEKPE